MRRQEADERGGNFVGTSDCSEYPEAEQKVESSLINYQKPKTV